MRTDGYALAIPEAKIRATLAVAVQHCRDVPANRRRACAADTIQRTLCPCALSAECVVDAVIQDFCEAVIRDGSTELRTAQKPKRSNMDPTPGLVRRWIPTTHAPQLTEEAKDRDVCLPTA